MTGWVGYSLEWRSAKLHGGVSNGMAGLLLGVAGWMEYAVPRMTKEGGILLVVAGCVKTQWDTL